MDMNLNFTEWLENRKQKKAQKKQEMLERMCCEAINVVEFDGELYISYYNAPIVPISSLKTDVEKVITNARKDYLEWRNKFGGVPYGKI